MGDLNRERFISDQVFISDCGSALLTDVLCLIVF